MKKLFRKNGDGTILFKSKKDLDMYIKEEARKELEKINIKAHEQSVEFIVAVVKETLYLQFGFGKKRMNDFTTRFNDITDCIGQDYVTLQELKNKWE